MPGFHTAQQIARDLGLTVDLISVHLQVLEQLGFIEASTRGYIGARDSVHLGRDSEIIGRYHSNWRLKAISDITQAGTLPGTHYSSIISMSAATAVKIKDLILKHIDETRDHIMPSPPDELYIYNLDFYPLLQNKP
jgi:predicted ArsR family transcriptional regulator